LQDKLLAESVCRLVSVLDGDEGVDGLAGQLVGNTNDSRLGNGVVLNQSSLNLSGRETVTADVDDIIDTASDPVEALVVTSSTITSELYIILSVFVSSFSRTRARMFLRSSPCRREGRYPGIACGCRRRYEQCWAMPA
jgi:hypothetical protein